MSPGRKTYRRRSTSTSAFGTSGRINHDSSKFYASRMYEGVALNPPTRHTDENPLSPEALDSLFLKSSTAMTELPDSSVHLMVTSPPYNVTKEYDEDLTLVEYRELLRGVLRETRRVLVDGGRACVNIANLGRKPYIPLHAYIIEDMLALGFHMRGEIIWNKGSSASPSTAWGSWQSASNPTLRDVHEYILVFSKGSFARVKGTKHNTITRDAFLEHTKSVWAFPAERARAVGHPAPFPVELPRRLIELYTFAGDVVLDPFCGSGTTCVAAKQLDRHYVGYDIKEQYIDLARRRLAELDQPADVRSPNGAGSRRRTRRG